MSSNIRILKICDYCKNDFIAKKTSSKSCSQSCATRLHRKNNTVRKVELEQLRTEIKRQTKEFIGEEQIKVIQAKENLTETKQSSWQKECRKDKDFKKFCQTAFLNSTLKLSRQDLFSATTSNKYSAIVLIIFWGYPRNMRGNNFSNILKCVPEIQEMLLPNGEWAESDFLKTCVRLKGKSIGLSTLFKILYFFRVKIEGKQCLILDQRIIQVLNSGLYEDFASLKQINEYNKVELYYEYLNQMNDAATRFKIIPDQLEYFLFHFGKNLKIDK